MVVDKIARVCSSGNIIYHYIADEHILYCIILYTRN